MACRSAERGFGVFGLQEIFVNFIAGPTALSETTLRVGDIITPSNGVNGTVEAIKTRSTTLKDWDNKGIAFRHCTSTSRKYP